jgi:hypothetical protein
MKELSKCYEEGKGEGINVGVKNEPGGNIRSFILTFIFRIKFIL